jgi:uncharacterized protein (DUF2062 family)
MRWIMRWFSKKAQILRHVDDSPARVAAAFGIGVFLAFFPLLGLHTGLALGIALLFRLNKVAILVGAWLNNPWTIAPMYSAGTLLGCALLRVPLVSPAASVDWSLKGRAFYEALATTLEPLVWPFVVGNLALGTAAGLAGFLLLRSVLSSRPSLPAASR